MLQILTVEYYIHCVRFYHKYVDSSQRYQGTAQIYNNNFFRTFYIYINIYLYYVYTHVISFFLSFLSVY